MNATVNSNNVTLTGYLGRDPEIRYTRVWTRKTKERVVSDDEYEYIIPPSETQTGGREFVVLSLATNTRTRREWRTDWHRVIAWDTDRGARRPTSVCRKGTKVRITGTKDSFTTTDGRLVEQVILKDLQVLDLRAPQLP